MKPTKIHAYGDAGRTICGNRLSQIPAKLLTQRTALVTCRRCLRTLEPEKEAAAPVLFRPAVYRPSFASAIELPGFPSAATPPGAV